MLVQTKNQWLFINQIPILPSGFLKIHPAVSANWQANAGKTCHNVSCSEERT